MSSTVTGSVVRDVVDLARRAPSIENSQPWAWRTTPTGLDLYADRSRRLTGVDPSGRGLVISCGAALHHTVAVAGALGWSAAVTRGSHAGGGEAPLARVALTRASSAPDGAEAVLRAVRDRRTDRRRFTTWPVPADHLVALARTAGAAGAAGAGTGARAVSVVDTSDRVRLDRAAVGEGHDLVASDGVVVLGARTDDPSSWLRTGEALSALWLHATRLGLAVVPMGDVIASPETRAVLSHHVLGGRAVPHVVVRLAWQPLSRGLAPTPRRALDDVLDGTGRRARAPGAGSPHRAEPCPSRPGGTKVPESR